MDATPSFLSRNDEDQQDDHVELQPPRAHHTPFQMYPPMYQTPKTDMFSGIQWHLVVLGIIIGAILMSMRPVIIKGSAA